MIAVSTRAPTARTMQFAGIGTEAFSRSARECHGLLDHLHLDVGAVCGRGDIGERRHEALVDDRPVTSAVAFEADESVGLVDDRRCSAVDRVRSRRR